MESIKIVKNGFFEIRKYSTHFIKFENITMIESPSRDYDTGRWKIEVRHDHLNEEKTYTIISNEKEAIALHKNLLDAWMSYHTNSTCLEEQIEKLLSCIDIIPGGKEYEETKNQFEKRVGEEKEEKEEKDEKFELSF